MKSTKELFSNWKSVKKAIKKKKEIRINNLSSEERFKGDILAKTARILKTQAEHIPKTIKRFLDDIKKIKRWKRKYYLELYNGSIIDRSGSNTNLITFDQTKFNLSNFTTKTTIAPKIQEQSTGLLIKCIRNFYKYDLGFIERNLNCNKNIDHYNCF